MYGWGASVVLPKEMEWAYKNQALKDGIDSSADGFVAKVSQGAEEGTVVGLDNQKFNEKKQIVILTPVVKCYGSVLHLWMI